MADTTQHRAADQSDGQTTQAEYEATIHHTLVWDDAGGHTHAGTGADGTPITKIGTLIADADFATYSIKSGANALITFASTSMNFNSRATTNAVFTAPDINGGTVDAITSLTVVNAVDIGSWGLRASTLTADGLTSGRVIFAGANGLLSDDSDFTFVTDTLTVTKIAATTFTGAISSAIGGNTFGSTTFSGTVALGNNTLDNVNYMTGPTGSVMDFRSNTNGSADIEAVAFRVRNAADNGNLNWLTVTGKTNTPVLDFQGRGCNNLGAAGNDFGASNTLVATTMSGNIALGQNAITNIGNMTIIPDTTGTLIDFLLETEWTIGTLINANFGSATTLTGTITGIYMNFDNNVTGKATGGANIRCFMAETPALIQTDTSSSNYISFFVGNSGALVQNTAAGTILWDGMYIAMPVITEATGTVMSDGIHIAMSTSTDGGDSYGIRITGATSTNFDNHAGMLITMNGAGDIAINVATGTSLLQETRLGGSLFITEAAAASGDVIGDGQIWIRDDAPNTLWFTDDDGTDHAIQTGASAVKHEFHVPFEDPTGQVGNWDVVEINTAQDTHFIFQVSESFEALVNAKVVMIPDTTETIQWDINVSVAASGEAYNNDDRSAVNQQVGVTASALTEVDISGQLTGIAGGDYVAIDFQSDTANLRIIGFEFDYT